MNTTKLNPEIEWRKINNKVYLYFTFAGMFTEEDATYGVIKWRELMGSDLSKRELIWNCLKMKGYMPVARNIWQKAIGEHKSKIGIIWLITTSGLIHAGAKIMSLFTPFNFKVVKTEEEIAR